ncbi:MAG: SDR family oxidoreductase [Simkania sp.]|nr:SDR family oxidoreductase [Simkania sp.]MCP5489996.1 SDR family oxidoreductase [Chlamydiales bacterium]
MEKYPKQKPAEVVMPVCDLPDLLKGQKAIVTGSSSGIGKGVAIALAKAGADVVINYAGSKERAEEVAQEVSAIGRQALVIKADVSQEDQVQAMFKETIEKFGTVDIVINNAGLQKDSCFADMTIDQWNKVIGINLTGQFLCSREAIREFLRRGIRKEVSCAAGKIICMSSVHEMIPWSGHANYAASKGGVMLLMKSIAQEYASQRIRVNSICPGAIRTPINKEAWDTPEAYEKLMNVIPYKRIGEPPDIGHTAVWLASDLADYINGTSIFVDGGMTLFPGFTTNG